MELIFEISKPGRAAADVPQSDVGEIDIASVIGPQYLREELDLPITPVRVLLELDFWEGDRPLHFAFVDATADASRALALRVHSDACWVEPSALAAYTFCPADQAFLAVGKLF